jgi:hypothetical protein
MSLRLPWIRFPYPVSLQLCRRERPFLFLAIIAAGSGFDVSDLQTRLLDEFYKTMAEVVIYSGQKRADIVHAIIIATLWTPPPKRLEDLRYSTNIHLATNMALDVTKVGPYEPPNTNHGQSSGAPTPSSLPAPQRPFFKEVQNLEDGAGEVEGWRTTLACYAGCAMLALLLRRPSVFRYNERVSQALSQLQESTVTTPSDHTVTIWIRLHRIAENLSDVKDAVPTGSNPDISTMKRLHAITFEARLHEWNESLTEVDKKSGRIDLNHLSIRQLISGIETLIIEYSFILLQTALFAITNNRQQYGVNFTNDEIKFQGMDIAWVAKSVTAAKRVLDTFLSIAPADIPEIPSVIFPRVIYSMMTLVKSAATINDLYDKDDTLSAINSSIRDKVRPGSVGLEDIQTVAIVEYCDRIIELLDKAGGPRPGRSVKVIGIITLLKRWSTNNIPSEELKVRSRAFRAFPDPYASKDVYRGSFEKMDSPSHDGNGPLAALYRAEATATTSSSTLPAAEHRSQFTATFNPINSNTTSKPGPAPVQGTLSIGTPPLQTTTSQDPLKDPINTRQSLTSYPFLPSVAPIEEPQYQAMQAQSSFAVNNELPFVPQPQPRDSYGNSSEFMEGIEGMEGIPPLNAQEQVQYGFLDALLGNAGGVPFALVNDTMASFGWM